MAVSLRPGLERRLKAELRRGPVRPLQSRALCHRRIPLPGDAGGRGRAARHRRSRARARARAPGGRERAAARRRIDRNAGRPSTSPSSSIAPSICARVIELDVPGRRCVVEPGIVLDDLNRALKAARPLVSDRRLDLVARHDRRHGGQQFLRRPLAALRHDARQRHLDRCDVGRRQQGAFRTDGSRSLGCSGDPRRCGGSAATCC